MAGGRAGACHRDGVIGRRLWMHVVAFLSLLTFAHSGTVVDDKGGNIFIISHLGLVFV